MRASADAADKLAAEVSGLGRQAIAIKADVGSEPDVINMFNRIDKELPPLAGLVNNAGILFEKSRLEATCCRPHQRDLCGSMSPAAFCVRVKPYTA